MKQKSGLFTVISMSKKVLYTLFCLFYIITFSGCPTIPDKNIADNQNTSMTSDTDSGTVTGTAAGTGTGSEGSDFFSSLFGGGPFSWPEPGIDMNEPVTRSVVNTGIAVAGLSVVAKIIHSIRKGKVKRR